MNEESAYPKEVDNKNIKDTPWFKMDSSVSSLIVYGCCLKTESVSIPKVTLMMEEVEIEQDDEEPGSFTTFGAWMVTFMRSYNDESPIIDHWVFRSIDRAMERYQNLMDKYIFKSSPKFYCDENIIMKFGLN